MNSSIDTISKRTLLFRYIILTVFTLSICSSIAFWIWSSFAYTRFMGFQGDLGINFVLDTDKKGLFMGGHSELSNIRRFGGLIIHDHDTTSVAAKAGLRQGDTITTLNGISLIETPQAYYREMVKLDSIGNIHLTVRREGKVHDVLVELKSIQLMDEFKVELKLGKLEANLTGWYVARIGLLTYILLSALLFFIGSFIGWIRIKNYVAFSCGFWFLGISALFIPTGLIILTAVLPTWIYLFWSGINMLAFALLVPLTIRFLGVFPRSTRIGNFLLKWQWVSFLIGTTWFLAAYYIEHLQGMFDLPMEYPEGIDSTFMIIYVLSSGIIGIILIIAQSKESKRKPDKKLKVIELGFAVAIGGVILWIVSGLFFFLVQLPKGWGNHIVLFLWLLPVISLSAIPISFAYTILSRKLFDIRFIIRKGLQYLFLSKGALVVEGVILFLILYQIISHGGTALASSPMLVSGISFGLGILGVFTLNRVNRKLMPVIDRRFFREVLDVRKLLMDLNEQLSEMREREKILQHTASTVLKALHPARVVMFLRYGKSDEFRCELTLENERTKPTTPSTTRHPEPCPDPDEVGRRINSGSEPGSAQMLNPVQHDPGIVGMLKADDPIIKQLKEKKGWAVVYPEALDLEKTEDQRLSVVNCELLIAIRGSSGLVGIMGLGGKLSEEPYSKEDRDLLTTVARQMGLSLENAELLEVAKREAEQSRDLEIARSVQQNLFPKQLPVVAGWEFAGICKPAKAVGGDYYDIFEAVPGKVVIALGDVSGKGLGASFVMSGVHSTIRTNAEKSIDNLVGLINELNKYLLGSTSKNIFVTLFLGIIDLETGLMRYVNCGHPPAFIVRKENGEIEKLTRTGLALGMMNTIQFTQGSSTLKVGDSLIVYSDGITEAMNSKEEMYEEERLTQLLATTLGLDSSRMMEEMLKSVSEFIGEAEQSDDVSIIVARSNFD